MGEEISLYRKGFGAELERYVKVTSFPGHVAQE